MLNPVRTTILFAMLSGVAMIPVLVLLPYNWGWGGPLKVILAFYLGVYVLLLCRWSKTSPGRIVYPLLFVAGAAFYPSTIPPFVLIGLAVLAWIRSGICYPDTPTRAFLAEVIVVTGGIIVLVIWPPVSPLAAGLGCWLFFLVQSLYFFGLPEPATRDSDARLPDRFEQISRDMEGLLADHQTPAG